MNTDTAYSDRQDLINNLPAVPVLAEPIRNRPIGHCEGEARESTTLESPKSGMSAGAERNSDSCGGRQTFPDTWEAIAAQLDHWRDMDAQYWQQRKEKEYATWLERTYGV